MTLEAPTVPYGPCTSGFTGLQIANVTILTILMAICVSMVGLRLHTRKRYVGALWLDDWAMFAATILLLPYCILIWYFTSLGFGAHFGCFPMSQAITLFKNSLALDVFFLLSLMFSRASVGLLLIRLFVIKKTARYCLWGLIIFQTLVTAVTIALVSPRCDPLEHLWDPSVPGKCFSPEAVTVVLYLNGATSIFSDFALALSPVYMLWNLQMSNKTKASVCLLLGLGFIPAASAFARTIYGCKNQGLDATYVNAWNAFAVSIEATCVIIAGTIPTLRSFVTHRKPSTPGRTPETSDQRKFGPHYTRISTPEGNSRDVSTNTSRPSLTPFCGTPLPTPEIQLGTYKAFGHATAERCDSEVDVTRAVKDGQIGRTVDIYVA